MAYWLFKSEPDCYGIDHLAAEPKQTTRWDGVRNFQARNLLRDKIVRDDTVLFYHSRCKAIGIVGAAVVVSDAYPDPLQFDPQSPYYDAKSTQSKPRWYSIDIKLQRVFNRPILLDTIKQIQALESMALRKQSRLSVQPVTAQEFNTLMQLIDD
ncbi:EVE domain-containing protein [Gilvimarinus sp. SDUM040013]|uniref:EVE domain-containing protein n=1 Tax=Gilvimarinus gilvus TaxID=3058038 RepID=A0ABU4RZQ8_9GAMM|nr:EVE domain-containing protein [Gilvimarinus sp. SDUM040013]MDO3385109.1 EVE domain-containing protein [Gilvimarinus sp. SDUM040013]MDX6848484.1 EVE domain-containing protein [Gilvimarinus sp. SDUM040013]